MDIDDKYMNLTRLSLTPRAYACIDNDGFHCLPLLNRRL